MLLGIHHAAIICSDYQKSKHFYVTILGLTVLAEHFHEAPKSYKLDLQLADKSQIELFSFDNPPKRPSYPEACGLRHLAFRVASIETAIEHLHSHHITVEPVRIDEYTGRKFTFFSDPDGLPLELYEL